MISYYRINVSLNGIYLFATEQGHLTGEKEAKNVFKILCDKFSTQEGYRVTCTYWQGSGNEMDWEAMKTK